MGLIGIFFGDRGEGYFNLDLGNYDNAIKYFNRAVVSKPDDYKSFRGLGLAYNNKEQPRMAIENFKKALSIKNTDYESFRGLGHSHIRLNEFDYASKNFDKALKIKNNDYISLRGKAFSLFNLKDYNGAVLFYNRALDLRPSEEALVEEALDCFDKIVYENPNHTDAWQSKAEILIKKDDFKGALYCLNKILEINPNDQFTTNLKIQSLKGISLQYYAENDIEAAIECLDVILSIQTDFESLGNKITYLEEQAIELNNRGYYDSSLDYFDKALECTESFPPSTESYTLKNNILLMKNRVILEQADELYMIEDLNGALSCYNQIIDYDQHNIDALKGKGRTLISMGDKTSALETFNSVLEINPNDVEAIDAISTLSESNQKWPQSSPNANLPEIKSEPLSQGHSKSRLLDINTATEYEIALLPEIGPILAKKTIQIREQTGGFKSVDDFCRKIDLQPHIAIKVEGLVCCSQIEEKEIDVAPITPKNPPNIRIVDITPKDGKNDNKNPTNIRKVDW